MVDGDCCKGEKEKRREGENMSFDCEEERKEDNVRSDWRRRERREEKEKMGVDGSKGGCEGMRV